MTPITRVLVANRGEIALRIIRACHEEGLEAVAVYSAADRLSPHVRAADLAVEIGPAAPSDSYLRIDRLLDAARATGAQAIHPGYGFLAERAAFAEAVERAGLVFVGPPSAAIRAMGDKTEARRRMRAAGVPVVPGADAPVTELGAALALAGEMGYPVMVKAAAGGGGKGMRVVLAAEELEGALATAASEALKAFGDAGVYIEKFIERPRHVEIQVLADATRTVHLGERERSVQRRHQKVLEEAPSVAVDAALRERKVAAAVAAAAAVGYRSAGTCEFLLAADGSFYFLEMNTRIQVEHPVTEMVYGIDLVREQLRIARGLPMQVPEGPLVPNGWAVECRITSEDPAHGFMPSTGRLEFLRVPAGPGVRWDCGFEVGNDVTLHHDRWRPVYHLGRDCREALRRMVRALDELSSSAGQQPSSSAGSSDPAFLAGRSTSSSSTAAPTRGGVTAAEPRGSPPSRPRRRTPRGCEARGRNRTRTGGSPPRAEGPRPAQATRRSDPPHASGGTADAPDGRTVSCRGRRRGSGRCATSGSRRLARAEVADVVSRRRTGRAGPTHGRSSAAAASCSILLPAARGQRRGRRGAAADRQARGRGSRHRVGRRLGLPQQGDAGVSDGRERWVPPKAASETSSISSGA
jgi:acetyl-CoA carboxylase biotin carboxylase subunit